jgi:hypothetical protein
MALRVQVTYLENTRRKLDQRGSDSYNKVGHALLFV